MTSHKVSKHMACMVLIDITWFVGCIQFNYTIMHILACQFDYQLHKITISLHKVLLLQCACNCSQAILSFELYLQFS